jgi:hypothetical protein
MTVPGAFSPQAARFHPPPTADEHFHSFRAIGFDTPSATQPQSRKIFRFA